MTRFLKIRSRLRPKLKSNEAGFTLVEVLAALLVFSIAIIGLTQAGTQSTRAVVNLEEKTLAAIIADNQLIIARNEPLRVGVQTGDAQIMSREFEYRLETEATEVANFFKMTLSVNRPNSQQVVSQRISYRRRT